MYNEYTQEWGGANEIWESEGELGEWDKLRNWLRGYAKILTIGKKIGK